MNYRTLGRTGLKVSLVGLGTGGPSRMGQATHGDEVQAHRVVRRALELGVNLFDTAADYGDSEAILGRSLAGVPREGYLLATKFLPVPEGSDTVISPAEMVASCERSLRRLRTDVIDVFQFHSVLPRHYRAVVDQLFSTAEQLKDEGKIRFIGITEYFFDDPSHEMLVTALEDDLWDMIMVKYGMLNLSAERRVLPLARERNVGVLNMSAVRVKLARPAELEAFVARLKQSGQLAPEALPDRGPLDFLVHGEVPSVVAAGYKFGAGHEAICSLLIGTANVAHLEENIATILGPQLPADDAQRIRDLFGKLAESEGDTG